MAAYYNENDEQKAAWLRELIRQNVVAPGEVDERSIAEVRPGDLRGFSQCHFFAGIGGWSYALRLAGWPDDSVVWTGSCPCQPFSSAARGRGLGKQCVRHLWPVWKALITARLPATVFGEQVAQSGDWIDEVCDDLEALGYETGAAILPACGVGKDHIRNRIYFVGHSDRDRESSSEVHAETPWMQRDRGIAGSVEGTHGLPGRMAAMCGYGNAIVPQVAEAFIRSYIEAEESLKL